MPDRVRPGAPYLRRGGRSFVPVGAHLVPPEGPDWPWRVGPDAFDRGFAAMAAAGMTAVRIDLAWAAVEPAEGRYDEAHLRVLDEVLDAAGRHGLLLHPALLMGGEVGDAFWDVPWRAGRHPHRDAGLVAAQAAHVAVVARRWAGDARVLAWDLTDEPPFWPFGDTTDDEARAWTAALGDAIRRADPAAIVTIGTAGQEITWGPFRADVVAEHLDVACVHPYPIYHPALFPDGLLSSRTTHAAAFETALAAGTGRPVMVHEYGASSAQFDPGRIAAHDRLLTWSSLGRGAAGFFAWCWADAEPAAYRRAPYVRAPHETQFGVVDDSGTLRPRGLVLAELAATVAQLDLDRHAGYGAGASAAIVVPHEYSRPYDSSGYGLDGAPSGIYVPAETAWTPVRDPLPLVAGWLNAYVLAARAGLAASFPRERLDGGWPDVPLLLLPAPLAGTSGSLHVRTAFWAGAAAHFARGGSAWVSCSADVAIPEMADVLGARLVDRAPAAAAPILRFVERWGPFDAGEALELPAGDGSLVRRSATLAAAAGSRVVAVDAQGDPALVVAPRGGGWAVVCSHPAELLLAGKPDAHGPDDRSWGLYAGLAACAGVAEPASADHPDVTSGSLAGPAGGMVVLTNHAAEARSATVRLPVGAVAMRLIEPGGSRGLPLEDHRAEVALAGHGAAVVTWDARP
jgi:beta-galactosidase